jgi:hypothetical protein
MTYNLRSQIRPSARRVGANLGRERARPVNRADFVFDRRLYGRSYYKPRSKKHTGSRLLLVAASLVVHMDVDADEAYSKAAGGGEESDDKIRLHEAIWYREPIPLDPTCLESLKADAEAKRDSLDPARRRVAVENALALMDNPEAVIVREIEAQVGTAVPIHHLLGPGARHWEMMEVTLLLVEYWIEDSKSVGAPGFRAYDSERLEGLRWRVIKERAMAAVFQDEAVQVRASVVKREETPTVMEEGESTPNNLALAENSNMDYAQRVSAEPDM